MDHPHCLLSFHGRVSSLLCLRIMAKPDSSVPTSWNNSMWPNFSPVLNLINAIPPVVQIPLWVAWGSSSLLCHVHRASFFQMAPEAVHRRSRNPQPKWSPQEPKMPGTATLEERFRICESLSPIWPRLHLPPSCSITLTPWGYHVSSPKSVINDFFFLLPLQGHLLSSPIMFIQPWALDSLPIDQTLSSKAQTRPKQWPFTVSLSLSSDLTSLLRITEAQSRLFPPSKFTIKLDQENWCDQLVSDWSLRKL